MAKMDKSIQKTLIIVTGIILLAIIGIIAYSSFSSANTVTGNGDVTIKVIPDEVSVYFNVESKGATSQEASSKTSDIVNNLTTALLQKGFNQSQIQTVNFNIYPDYNYNNGQQTQNR